MDILILVDEETRGKGFILLEELVGTEVAKLFYPYLLARARRESYGVCDFGSRGVFLDDLLELGEREVGSLEGRIRRRLV